MTGRQPEELVADDAERLRGLERRHRRRASRPWREQRELPERLSRSVDGEHRRLSQRSQDPHGEAALHDQLQRVGGIAVVEDDLLALERPPTRDREELAHVLRRHGFEHAEFHPDAAYELSPR